MQNSGIISKNIPNAVTLLNLISGCISITMAMQEEYVLASTFILIAAAFDFIDGLLAKALNAVSDFGRVLDSISDVVSFGVAPAILMFQILNMSLIYTNSTYSMELANFQDIVILLSAFSITIAAAIRLARFTSMPVTLDYFEGMPTPASAVLFASLGFIIAEGSQLHEFILNKTRLVIFIVIVSILMISKLPMLSLKFSSLNVKENAIKYIFIFVSVILLVSLKYYAIPLVIVAYVLLSIINLFFIKPE